jgi:NAD(P)H-hydrate epimerase
MTRPDAELTPIPAHQLDILHRMHVSVQPARAVADVAVCDLIIDGIIGYSLAGAPRGTAADLIRWANQQTSAILALDAPSGVDTTSGTAFEPSIEATATMTLALPKEGLRADGVEKKVGELYLADISVPPGLYAGPQIGLSVGPLFAESDIVRI